MFCYVGSCIKLLYTKVEDYSNRVFVQKYIIKVHADINFYVKWENLWQMYVQANNIMPKRKGKTNFTKVELKIIHPHAIFQLSNESSISSIQIVSIIGVQVSIVYHKV